MAHTYKGSKAPAGNSKGTAKPQDDLEDKFQTEDDARTLERHAEIVSDSGRHQKATDHLGKKAQTTADAHQMARKQLEKKTKGRLKKVFGGGKGGTFQDEKDRETAGANKIVKED